MRKIFYLGVVILLGLIIYVNRGINAPINGPAEERFFNVVAGDGLTEIADKLQEQNFIESPLLFKFYAWAGGKRSAFWAGEYQLRGNMSIAEIVARLTERENIVPQETAITLIEGWSVEKMDEYLTQNNLIKQGELVAYSEKYQGEEFDFLNERPRGASLEGYLYPDTYRVYTSSSVESLARRMLTNFDEKITPELRAEIKKQGRSLFEVLTLASIVEQEMHGYENRRRVAGVFLTRLKIGMALQSDATINYLTRSGRTRSTAEDLEIDSPYNTYKYPGLPPGPICNPNIEAIKAVIYPNETGDLYFLTGKDGNIYFAKTFDEHVANKQRYLY